MAQTYTLEEAATRLGISPEEFKRRLRDDWKSVRSFRDGATLRFRAADIDELARTLGQASDPGLPLTGSAPPLSDDSDELHLHSPSSKKGSRDQPLLLTDDSDDILALPGDEPKPPKSKPKGDSDVRLDMSPRKASGDNLPTEELSLDVSGPTSGVGLSKSGTKLTNPKSSGRLSSGSASKIPTSPPAADDGSSEFELSLDSDSDSFELQLTNDSSEEVPLGSDVPAGVVGSNSGINLGRPADSGVSIEKKKPAPDDSDADFELSIDSPATGGSGLSLASADEASSEFELSLDDSSGSESMNALASSVQGSGDIFETDFELPAVEDESGSEVVSVESDTDLENSDFEVAITEDDVEAEDGSASEVVLMSEDEEEAAVTTKSGRGRSLADMDLDADEMVASSRGRDDVPVRTVVAPPPKWGPLPAAMLALTFPIVMLGGLMAFELVRSMAGYQQTSTPLVNWAAGLFGFKAGGA